MVEDEKEQPKLEAVKIILAGEKMSLVELIENGLPVRISVPNKDIKDGFITLSAIKKGIPFGIPFETLDFPQLSAQDIGNICRTHGLWTPDDFRTKPKEVMSALMSIAGKYFSVLLAYIKNK